MIRINLLLVKAAQKKDRLRSQLVILGLSIAGAVAGCSVLYGSYLAKVSAERAEIAQIEQRIQGLKKTIGEVAEFKKLQEELRGKLTVLENLKNARSGPVRLLDELSKALPDKLWLTSFKEAGGSISINGVGLNEEVVADFMRNLERSPHYRNVELKVVEQTAEKEQKLHKFDVGCQAESAPIGPTPAK